MIGWKCFYGTLMQNQTFFARIESVVSGNSIANGAWTHS
jgi:hypothetical protein